MALMTAADSAAPAPRRRRAGWIIGLVLIVGCGALLRFSGLGDRSLWYDEFSTWHVSRLPLAQSLRWLPEVNLGPLYQLCLRGVARGARPSERALRLPAAAAGVLTLLAGYWLGSRAGGPGAGCALAALIALNELQLDYSQEARPYSMLVLGTTLATALWHRLVSRPRVLDFGAYVASATLALHAHYLAGLTLLAHACWWAAASRAGRARRRSLRPFAALALTAALCTPIVFRYFHFRWPAYSGLQWVPPPTWSRALGMLEQLTAGRVWVVGLLLPGLVLWLLGWAGLRLRRLARPGGPLFAGAYDLGGLLGVWLAFAYLGPLVISGLVRPLMVARYVLPAAVPGLLLPLLVACRLDRRLPLAIAAPFAALALPAAVARGVAPGFRELVGYLNEHVDPAREAVVMGVFNTAHPEVVACEMLGFKYYPLERAAAQQLWLGPDPTGRHREILADPRGLYLVVFQGDPEPLLARHGRRLLPFIIAGRAYARLYFEPYRLLRVAPLGGRAGPGPPPLAARARCCRPPARR